MPENASTTELASQYTVQVTADLEQNAKEQERVSAEIAALNEQLSALRRDYAVLVNIQKAIGATAPTASRAAQSSDGPAAPASRKKASGTSGTNGKRTQTKKTAPKTPAARPWRTAPAKAVEDASPKRAQPTLVDLVHTHLIGQSKPRSAAEITMALGQSHTGRIFKTTVVRTTLEGLVAKNKAQRTKQGTSVFYTATDQTPSKNQAADPAHTEKQPAHTPTD